MKEIISQLNADQLARHAFNIFLYHNRHVVGARLIFRALELDCREPTALRCLSDILDAEGTEQLSAVTLEYALAPSTGIQGEERNELDDLRFLAQWTWGFSRHNSGDIYLAPDAFGDRSAFSVDEEGYAAFLAPVTGPAHSLEYGFQAAHTLCGTIAGLLVHKSLGKDADVAEVFYPERFVRTPEYDKWLRTSTRVLDALERDRNAKDERPKRWWKLGS